MTRNIVINILLLFIYFIISNTYLFNMKIADKLYNIKRYRNTDEMYLNLKLRRKRDSHNSNINNNSNINYNSTMIH
jgi:hypothetical protein